MDFKHAFKYKIVFYKSFLYKLDVTFRLKGMVIYMGYIINHINYYLLLKLIHNDTEFMHLKCILTLKIPFLIERKMIYFKYHFLLSV